MKKETGRVTGINSIKGDNGRARFEKLCSRTVGGKNGKEWGNGTWQGKVEKDFGVVRRKLETKQEGHKKKKREGQLEKKKIEN